MADSLPFRLTNRVANPVLRRLLRTRAGRRPGRRLAVLRYSGIRTGRPHEVVVLYARTGPTVWVLVGQSEHKSWWRSLAAPADVVLWLAGERVSARAVAVEGAEQPAECRRGLVTYLRHLPWAARGVGLRGPDDPALGDAVARAVMVRADIRPEPDAAA